MDTNKEITIMVDKKNASISWFNATNNATELLDIFLKNKLCEPKTIEEAMDIHNGLRNSVLIAHSKFTVEVLSKVGIGPSEMEIDSLLKKIKSLESKEGLRTLYLTTREALRQNKTIYHAMMDRKAELA